MGDDVLDARSTVLEEKSDISLPRSQQIPFAAMILFFCIEMDAIFISAARGSRSRMQVQRKYLKDINRFALKQRNINIRQQI